MIDTEAKVTETDEGVLEELETRRAELAKWHQAEGDYSREGMAARAEREALEAEIRKMVNANPLLIDGDGQPVGRTNPVAKAQAALEKAPDPDAIFRRRDHAAAVVRKLTEDLAAFVREHFDEIHAARFPQAVEVRDAVMQHRDAYLAATEQYLAFARETVGLCAPHDDFDGRDVHGIDEGSELARVLERVEHLPLPTIGGTGPEIGARPEAVFFERPTEDGSDQ